MNQFRITGGDFGEETAQLVLMAPGAQGGADAAGERFGPERALQQCDTAQRVEQAEPVAGDSGGGAARRHDEQREIRPGRLVPKLGGQNFDSGGIEGLVGYQCDPGAFADRLAEL